MKWNTWKEPRIGHVTCHKSHVLLPPEEPRYTVARRPILDSAASNSSKGAFVDLISSVQCPSIWEHTCHICFNQKRHRFWEVSDPLKYARTKIFALQITVIDACDSFFIHESPFSWYTWTCLTWPGHDNKLVTSRLGVIQQLDDCGSLVSVFLALQISWTYIRTPHVLLIRHSLRLCMYGRSVFWHVGH